MSGLAGGHLGDLVAALVDDQLDHSNRDLVLAHLAGCDTCRADVQQERALKSRLRALSAPGLPESLLGRLAALSSPPDGGDGAPEAPRVGAEPPVRTELPAPLSVVAPLAVASDPTSAPALVRTAAYRDPRRGRLLAGAASLLLVGVGAAYAAAADAAQSTSPAHPAANSLAATQNVATTTSVMLNDPAFEAMTASYSR